MHLFSVIKPYDAKKLVTRKSMTLCTVLMVVAFTILNGYIVLVELGTKTLPSGRWIFVYPDTPLVDLRQFLIGQIPILLLIPSNTVIIIKLWNQRRKWKNLKTNNQQKREERRSFQLTVMILSLTITFIILTLPFSIYMMAFYKSEQRSADAKVRNILSVLPIINASITFYLYFLSSEIYRKEVKKQLVKVGQVFGLFDGYVEPVTSRGTDTERSSNQESFKSRNITSDTKLSVIILHR